MAYVEVIDFFNEHSASGDFKPKYFSSETEAKSWLNAELNIKVSKREEEGLTIIFKEIDDKGKAVFEFKEDASNFDSTINSLRLLLSDLVL